MTPKFRGIGERLKKLQHSVDHHADELGKHIDRTEARVPQVFDQVKKAIDAQVGGVLEEVNGVLDDLQRNSDFSEGGSNGSSEPPRSSEIATVRK